MVTDLTEPARHLFTVDDLLQMVETGILPEDAQVELIQGEIIDMPPPSPEHAAIVARLNAWFVGLLTGRAVIWPQNPVRLGDLSLPMPDLGILSPRDDFYRSAHPKPEHLLLLVEVSVSTLRHDESVKRGLYGRYGVPEYWIVDVRDRCVLVLSDPCPDGYATSRSLRVADALAPAAFPEALIQVAELLA